MSVVNYNNVALTFLQMRRWLHEPIRVGQDIAGFRYTATMLAYFHSNTITNAVGAGNVLAGLSGAELWIAVREQLMAPRQSFLWILGDVTIASVAAAPNLDYELGPHPLSCNAIQFNSTGSILVEYTIQWATQNPCLDVDGATPLAVLAHVWAVDEDLDEDFFLTRTYRGRIRFNPLVAGPAGTIHPDRLRPALLPPLVQGLRREGIMTKMSEDGFTFDYILKDIQPYQLVNSAVISRIEATHSVKQDVPTKLQYAEAINRLGSISSGIAGHFRQAKRDPLVPLQHIINAGVTGVQIAGSAAGLLAYQYSAIPIAAHLFEATAYGTNAADYVTLAQAARVVCLWRVMKYAPLGLAANWGGTSETINQSDPRAVKFTMTVNSRPRQFQEQGLRTNPGPGRPWERLEVVNIWNDGHNEMPDITKNFAPQTITDPAGGEIPNHIKQLLYGGTPGFFANDWNGLSAGNNAGDNWSFAPDLFGKDDANNPADPLAGDAPGGKGITRPNFVNGIRTDGQTQLQLCLIAALQDPCTYKNPRGVPMVGFPVGSANGLKTKPVYNFADLPGM